MTRVSRWLRKQRKLTPAQKREQKRQAKRDNMKVHSWDHPCGAAAPHRAMHSNKLRWDVRLHREYPPNSRVPQYMPYDVRNRLKITCRGCKAAQVEHVLEHDLDTPLELETPV